MLASVSCTGRAALAPACLTLLVALTAWAAGCAELDNPHLPFPEPEYEQYVAEVQPVVATRCASLGCHGAVERSLSLYAVGYLRAAPVFAGTPLDEHQLTEAELAWNHESMRMRLLDASSPETTDLMLKCVPPGLGGYLHADGIVVFETLDDPDYQTLIAWIGTAL